MEELLIQLEQEGNGLGKLDDFVSADVAVAVSRFAGALRVVIPLLREDVVKEDKRNLVDAKWLLELCKQVPSELGPERLARTVWEVSKLRDEGQQQEALFEALGASDEAMSVLFEVAPKLAQIQRINPSDLGGYGGEQVSLATSTLIDPAEENRRKLRQEAIDAAQVAAIAKAEVESLSNPLMMGGATHTITRSSDVKAKKAAEKAAKRAAQAFQRAKAAGAIIDESDLLSVDNSNNVLGEGGLIGRSTEELQALQQSLLPEGSRQYYNAEGLPHGTVREYNDEIGYESVAIPPPKVDKSLLHPRLNIRDILDPACAMAFAGTNSLNPMQSAVFDTAFNRRENLLVCAPTGAGKTNVAMLTVTAHFRDVGLIGHHQEQAMETGQKVTYIAPMKALAQEVVEKFSSKLKPLGLIVRELTGDMQLTRAEAQSANVIVTTPEKWDVVTRKSGNDDNSLGNQCGLLIIDEVHLLADERGAVIESVVSRLHRLVESRQRQLRIVGLSATLPNYQDVAEFLQVPERGIFFFGGEHRPVPLQQKFIGVSGRVKDRQLMENKMNDVCYEAVKDALERGYQVMVFVHSRKATGDTCRSLADRAAANNDLDRLFVTQGKNGKSGDANLRYMDRVKKSRNREVTNHFYNGMGIHHAGMLRGDRKLTESMFSDGAIKVLCCTATLAWGVNLLDPSEVLDISIYVVAVLMTFLLFVSLLIHLAAHTVIIKGTDVYNPEKGKMVDLSILDVQQIFGRAGRPQFDTSGEATLITNHEALPRYIDKLVRAVPIESNFIKQLADHLNAEVVGGTVSSLNDAVTWIGYTYLFVRMKKNPLAYGINADQFADDPMLRGRCRELVQQAATLLAQNKMMNFHPESGNLSMTDLGRVAAHFYVQAESVKTFNDMMELNPSPSDSDLCRVIASATEFTNLRVRQEEQGELDGLQESCPLKYEGQVHDSTTKSFVLMQAFISRMKIKSFTLISDTNYIAANAGRVSRAIFEMCMKTNQASTALKMLRFAKSFDNQFWWFQTPLRHFESDLGINVIKALESRQLGSNRMFGGLESTLLLLDMTPEEVGQLCRGKKHIGEKVQKLVGMIPKPGVSCRIMPITRSVLRFHIRVTPDFEWHPRWHGGAMSFWLWIEDTDTDRIYHHEHIIFSKRKYPEPLDLDIPVPAFEPIPSEYLVRVVSDSWVGVEVIHTASLRNINMPEQKTPYTDLLNLTPLPVTSLQEDKYIQLYSNIETFNPVQTQLFHVLYHTDSPVFLGAPTGSGKTFVAELALLRMKRIYRDGICVYIAPLKSLARERLKEWQRRLGSPPLNWKVLELSGDTHHDQKSLNNADILVCTPEKYDLISRGWKGNSDSGIGESFVQRVRLLVVDEIHLLGEERGAVLEAIVSRTRFISQHLEENGNRDTSGCSHEIVRIVGLSTAVSNPLDLADWIGIDTEGSRRGLYNFRPSIRPVPTKIHIQGYPGKHYCPRMATMNKPCYAAIKQHSPDRPSLIFVASRRQTRLTAFAIISYAAGDENPKMFLGCDDSYIDAVAESIHDEALRHTIGFGIGLHHAGLSAHDREIVERLYLSGEIRVLVATSTLSWGVNLPSRLVIIKGTEYFDGKSSRYIDYPLTDVLQMIGRAGRPGFDTEGRAVVLVESSKKNFYKKFLYTPFPVESCLSDRLCENLNAEIAIGTVNTVAEAIGYLTWTFFSRRVKANPSYYGAESSSDEDYEEFLYSVVRGTLETLHGQGCIKCDGIDDPNSIVESTPLGEASSRFYLKHSTPKQMQAGVQEALKIVSNELAASAMSDVNSVPKSSEKHAMSPFQRSVRLDEVSAAWLLFSLSCTHEFDEVPVRHNEEQLNEELSDMLSWGADAGSALSAKRERTYKSPDTFADPHTKTFLLIQAYLERTRLPISDYVNDTKSVVDNVPRLLAAMQFIAMEDPTKMGSFELVCQFSRIRQLLETRSMVDTDPLLQLPGINKEVAARIRQDRKSKDDGIASLFAIRRLARDEAASLFKKVTKGKVPPIRPILDFLYSTPLVTIEALQVLHRVNMTSGTSRGNLKLILRIQRDNCKSGGKEASDFALSAVLGSFQRRGLLAHRVIQISRTGTWSQEVNIEFDWDAANADGGDGSGSMILRLIFDQIRGLDAELVVAIR